MNAKRDGKGRFDGDLPGNPKRNGVTPRADRKAKKATEEEGASAARTFEEEGAGIAAKE